MRPTFGELRLPPYLREDRKTLHLYALNERLAAKCTCAALSSSQRRQTSEVSRDRPATKPCNAAMRFRPVRPPITCAFKCQRLEKIDVRGTQCPSESGSKEGINSVREVLPPNRYVCPAHERPREHLSPTRGRRNGIRSLAAPRIQSRHYYARRCPFAAITRPCSSSRTANRPARRGGLPRPPPVAAERSAPSIPRRVGATRDRFREPYATSAWPSSRRAAVPRHLAD